MTLVRLLGKRALAHPGEAERHFGYDFLAGEDGGLTADIPAELARGEIAAGRVAALEPGAPPEPPQAGPEPLAGAGKGRK